MTFFLQAPTFIPRNLPPKTKRGVKATFKMDHIKDITNKMRELATNPTTPFVSHTHVSPTNESTSRDTANVSGAFDTDAATLKADANSDANTDTNANTSTNPEATSISNAKPKPPTRTEYHAHLAEILLHRLSLLSASLKPPLGLTNDYAQRNTTRTLEEMVDTCRNIAASIGLSQEKEIEYLQQKMEEVEAMRLVGAISMGAEGLRRQMEGRV